MENKIRLTCTALAAIGSGLGLFICGFILEIFPTNPYRGVFWMVMLPMVLFYTMKEPKRKDILNLLCSFAAGLVWGFVSVATTQAVKMAGGPLLFTLVEYGLMTAAIIFVHGGLLANTPFNKPAAAFLGLALSVAASTTSFWSGGIDFSNGTLIPIEGHWNQFDLLIVFAIGCAAVWLVETLGGLLVGMYMKKLHQNN